MSPIQTTNLSEETAQNKQLLRFHIRRMRQRFPASQKTLQGFTRAIENEVGSSSHLTIAAFLPLASEPPIKKALGQLIARGHTILVPRILPHHQLSWVRWTPGAATSTHALGIEEPLGEELTSAAFLEADLRLVPALAYDVTGRRLGQGGGYYDRLLEELDHRIRSRSTVGVAFEREILTKVPADHWDARLSYVLTESGVHRLGKACCSEPVE